MISPALAWRRAPWAGRLPSGFAHRPIEWLRTLGLERCLVLAMVIAAGITHSINMLNFPATDQFNDEGVYAEHAWAVLHGMISPYTFDYGHVPAGWIFMAVWMALTGGLHTFGGAVATGRVFILALDLAGVAMLYRLARKLGCGIPAAAFATVLLVISPLAIYYQRLVLIDNMMLFWALLSLNLLLDDEGRLSRVALSGLCLGIAALTKETVIVLAPAMLLLAIHQRRPHQGSFALAAWLFPMVAVVSLYPLYALLKGEVLPAGHTIDLLLFKFSTGTNHVSLLDAMTWQATRSGGGFFNFQNSFWFLVHADWLPRDAMLFCGGILAAAANIVRGYRDRRALVAGLLVFGPLLYLARGGVVFHFYILAALPFFCLNIALLVSPLLEKLRPADAASLTTLGGLALFAGYLTAGTFQPLFTSNSDAPARQALAWIQQHVPPQSLIIGGDDMWVDLRDPSGGAPAFTGEHSHFKVALDPAVREGIFDDRWETVDYLILEPGFRDDFVSSDNTVALEALNHAHLVKRWQSGATFAEVWKVDKPGATETGLLQGSYTFMAHQFEHRGAYVASDGSVTSQSQASALLRAVYSNDRPEFDRVWTWTQANLQRPDGLLAARWQGGSVKDARSMSGADTDAALALLLGGSRWDDSALVTAGTALAHSIWQGEVVTVRGRPYLAAGDWAAAQSGGPILSPSHFAPYAYHIFEEVDSATPWLALVDSSYDVLFAPSLRDGGFSRPDGVPPEWLRLDRATGDVSAVDLSGPDSSSTFGYDAARTYWRTALDLAWNGDGRAEAYAHQADPLRDQLVLDGDVGAVRTQGGVIVDSAPRALAQAGTLAAALSLNYGAAGDVEARIAGSAEKGPNGTYWGSPDDLRTQEWRWFATALYAGALPDLWHGAPASLSAHARPVLPALATTGPAPAAPSVDTPAAGLSPLVLPTTGDATPAPEPAPAAVTAAASIPPAPASAPANDSAQATGTGAGTSVGAAEPSVATEATPLGASAPTASPATTSPATASPATSSPAAPSLAPAASTSVQAAETVTAMPPAQVSGLVTAVDLPAASPATSASAAPATADGSTPAPAAPAQAVGQGSAQAAANQSEPNMSTPAEAPPATISSPTQAPAGDSSTQPAPPPPGQLPNGIGRLGAGGGR